MESLNVLLFVLQSEFDDITREHGVEAKLASIDALCKEKGVAIKDQVRIRLKHALFVAWMLLG